MSFYLASLFCRLQTFVFALLFYGIFLLVDDVNTSCQAVKCIVDLYVRADFCPAILYTSTLSFAPLVMLSIPVDTVFLYRHTAVCWLLAL